MKDVALRWPDDTPPEYNLSFLQGMLNRMAVSFHKYGLMKEAAAAGTDQIASLKVRLQRYEETGNTEWLMDVANMAMIEFTHPLHPDAHYRATDSDESPGRVIPSRSVMGDSMVLDARHNKDIR